MAEYLLTVSEEDAALLASWLGYPLRIVPAGVKGGIDIERVEPASPSSPAPGEESSDGG